VKHLNSLCGLAAIGLMICCGISASTVRADEASKSIWDGVYTVGQAQRGAAAYASHCVSCHMESLEGDGADTPALSGKTFLNTWDGLSLAELFDRIQTSMPQSNPGILSAQEVADLMAYLLSANQIPAGTKELPNDPPSLQSIQFDAKRPKH
jgi:S-disulfanyl-L-cysteine oxidoreductase SoxD